MPANRPRATVSVLCPTNAEGRLVAVVLGELRDAVDEIVVAADARVGAEDLGFYETVADRLIRYEHSGPNRHWGWLAEQASCDWLLLLDGDELLSSELLAALPDLVADRRVRQHSLNTTWVWPSAGTRLDDEPWRSSHRVRMVRNDDRLYFTGEKHVIARDELPIRYDDGLGILHLDLVLPDRARREAKVRRYDAERFGLLNREGEPYNRVQYLPEASPHARTAALPPEDHERVARVLAALDLDAQADREEPPPLDPERIELHDRRRVEHVWPGRSLTSEAYRATITLERPLPRLIAGAPAQIWVRVANEGTADWPGGESRKPLIRIGIRWRDAVTGNVLGDDTGRVALPHALGPGEGTLVPMTLTAPPASGATTLEIDLVHDAVRWFGCSLRLEADVEPGAAERLERAQKRHGPVVPLDVIRDLRRSIPATDALAAVHRGANGARPSDPGIAELVEGLTLGGWAVDGPTIDRVVQLIRDRRPGAVLEFGSGTSTVVLAHLLAGLPGAERRLVTIEADPYWLHRTSEALDVRGLASTAALVHAPVAENGTVAPPCYAMPPAALDLLGRLEPDVVLVDGPAPASGASRVGVLDIVKPHLGPGAVLLLDDALRDAELCVAETWAARADLAVDGIRLTPKGLLEATVVGE